MLLDIFNYTLLGVRSLSLNALSLGICEYAWDGIFTPAFTHSFLLLVFFVLFLIPNLKKN